MDEMMDKYKELFLEEAEEYIIALNDNLIALEKEGGDRELIDNIFRVVHTLKSSAAAVGYDDLSVLSHKAEDLMQQIRSGDREVTSIIVDALFEVFDIVKEYVECIKDNTEIDVDIDEMIKKLDKIIKSSDKPEEEDNNEKEKNDVKKDNQAEEIVLNEYEIQVIKEEMKKGKKGYILKIEVDPRESLKWLRAELLLNNISKIGEIVKIYPEKEEFLSRDFTGFFWVAITSAEDEKNIPHAIIIDLIKEITIEPVVISDKNDTKDEVRLETKQSRKKARNGKKSKKTETVEDAEEIKEIKEDSDKYKTKRHQITESGDTIRVPVKKLDELMHLIGELVITNSGLKIIEQKISEIYRDTTIYTDMSNVTDKLINISSELQNSIMKTRMLPISNIFTQFNRIVRDLAKEEKKEIDLIIEGGDTELDKKMIDSVGDPLMHLVRNSVDHGIEHPADRIKKRKPPKGTITLSASQSGNHIILYIKDDGKGIDVEKVKKAAIEKKIIQKNAVEEMNEQQILNLIFEPGFTTSEYVSAVSGRGVGLDVVKTTVMKLNGTVEVNTEPGKGTEFIITLPLTLAITSVIMVQVDDIDYAIPITDIEETLKVKKEEISTIQGIQAIKLRDEILPLVNLKNIFNSSSIRVKEANINEGINKEEKLAVVVVSYRNKKTGLIVDKIIGKLEIVLKSLEDHYHVIKGLSGAAILGDGKIVLVVDVLGIMNIIKEISEKLEEITKQEKKSASRLIDKKEKGKIIKKDEEKEGVRKKKFASRLIDKKEDEKIIEKDEEKSSSGKKEKIKE